MPTQTVLNESIHGYRITKLIAEGGMASVYLGENNIGKKRAVKILKPFLLQAHPSLRQRFEQEARIITQLDHPNIRKVEALVATPDSVAMLMDYLEGSDLSAYVESGHYVSTAQKLAWFCQVLSALGYAHGQPTPVVHRDIKPSNIFITKDGQVQLLDFGIAKLIGEDADLSQTLTQLGAGTPRYRSPEQVKAGPIDHRSDIYSLGVTLWVLLAGQVIYKDDPGEFTMSVRIVHDLLPPLPNVSARLNAIIQKATAKDPNDRFQSCYQFEQALQALSVPQPEPPLVTPPPGPGYVDDNTVLGSGGTRPDDPIPNPPVPRPRSARWVPWSICGVIALILLLAWAGLREPSAETVEDDPVTPEVVQVDPTQEAIAAGKALFGEKKYDEAFQKLLPHHDDPAFDAEAQTYLGEMHLKGWGTPVNAPEAAVWFSKAALQGNRTAQSFLGYLYLNGQGIPQNDAEAANWFRQAAEAGDDYSQYHLGTLYQAGRGVPEDAAEACKWFRKAAEAGNSNAQDALGLAYESGTGVEQDPFAAVAWFRKAAESGNSNAQSHLGLMYENGSGVEEKDFYQAVSWYQKAADAGNSAGQFYLGDMYEYGKGVTQDLDVAVSLYRKAAEGGSEGAQKALKRLELEF